MILNFKSKSSITVISFFSLYSFSYGSMQFPSGNDASNQLLVPITSLNAEFSVNDQIKDPSIYHWIPNDQAYIKVLNKNENGLQCFVKIDEYGYEMGQHVNTNKNQVLKFKGIKAYASKILLSYACNLEYSFPNGSPVFQVTVTKMKMADIINNTSDPVVVKEITTLNIGTHIVSTNINTPSCPYIKHKVGEPYYGLTIPIDLNKANYGLAVSQIEIKLLSNTSTIPWAIVFYGLNLQTYIDAQAPTFFSQGGPSGWGTGWGNETMNIGLIRNQGCYMTSAAMALVNLGITKDPDGNPITPGTLNSWLKANDGYYSTSSGKKTDQVPRDLSSIVSFANKAKANNNNKSVKIEIIRDLPDADIRNKIEEALANNYLVLLRVSNNKPTTTATDCSEDRHTLLAYGMVPDFINNVYGTYKINDPGRAAGQSAPNLFQRITCSTYKGKFLFGYIVKPTAGVTELASPLTLILHSPGKIYYKSLEGYEIGYKDGVGNLINTFPANSAFYENRNLYESYLPDDGQSIPSAENIQIVTIYNRPAGKIAEVKAIGTGTGSYTFEANEKIWDGTSLVTAFNQEHTGQFTSGKVDIISVPANSRATGSNYTLPTQTVEPPPAPNQNICPDYVKSKSTYTLSAKENHGGCLSGFYIFWDYDNDPNSCEWYRDLSNPSHFYSTPGVKHIKVKYSISTWCIWSGDSPWIDSYDRKIKVISNIGPIINMLLE